MIFASSFVMGGGAVDDPDELDAIEIALEDEPDEPDEDSTLLFGLKGDDCPVNRERRGHEYVGGGVFAGGRNIRGVIYSPKATGM